MPAPTIRIAFVAGSPGLQGSREHDEACLRQLRMLPPGFAVELIASIELLPDRLARGEAPPDLVLLEAGGGGPPGHSSETLERCARLRTLAPGQAIVLLVSSAEQGLALEALRRGVQECLPHEILFSTPALLRHLRYALERAGRERALHAQLRRITLLLHDIPDYVYFKDEHGAYLEVNEALARRFALSEATEVIGRTDAEYFEAAQARASLAEQQEIVRTGQASVAQLKREQRRDGQVDWCLASQFPFRDASGEIIGTYGIEHDVTEQRRGEQAMRESEERYRRLLDSVSDYVYTVTIEGGQAVSTSHGPGCLAVTGYSAEQFHADPNLWHHMTHEGDRTRVIEAFQRLMTEGEPVTIEHRLRRADGEIRWVQNKQVPRHDGCGTLVGYDGLISDITERKQAEELLLGTNARLEQVLTDLTGSHEALQATQMQLIEAEKLQSVGQLAAGVAHEVKNPLAILQMGLQFFRDGGSPLPEGGDTVLAEMQTAVERATAVINDLLHFSAQQKLDLRERPLAPLVEKALSLVQPQLDRAGVWTVRRWLAGDRAARVDAAKLGQVLVHVLLNAADAMPDGGQLTVTISARTLASGEVEGNPGDRTGRPLHAGDRVLMVEIADTGTGMSADALTRVFDPFFTTKGTGQGKGLGLSVAQRIVRHHFGEITIASKVGEGTTVTVLLPEA